MTDDDLRKVAQIYHDIKRGRRKRGMEFSKCILIFAAVICAGTWIVTAVSWFLWRDFPYELVRYTGWFFGAVAAYMGKTAYENKPKIEGRREDGDK